MLFKKSKTSPNFDERANGVSPSMIVLHYTGMKTADAALERLCDPDAKVSAHYFIDEQGGIENLVADDKRAWHAGVAHWAGLEDVNSHSIGIELVNSGHEFGYEPFPEAQIAALIKLCHKLIKKYEITPDKILAHSDVAPSRKQDPGELFPWETLALDEIGLWPQPEEMDYQAAEDLMLEESSVHELLGAYGYNVAESFCDLVTVFHRRYYPEKFEGNTDPSILDVRSIAKLLSLVRLRHECS